MACGGRKLSLNTKSDIFEVFMKYDQDRNGFISQDEAHHILKQELGFVPKQTKELLQQCDSNGDGKLSFQEFVEFYYKVKERLDEVNTFFSQLDAKQEGYVTVQDAVSLFRDRAFQEDEIQDLLRIHDCNGDGVLQYEEFVKLWNFLYGM